MSMDLSSQRSINAIRLSFFLMLGFHFYLYNNDSWGLRISVMAILTVIYVVLVFAKWQRNRTTRTWAIPLALSGVGLVVAYAIISTSH